MRVGFATALGDGTSTNPPTWISNYSVTGTATDSGWVEIKGAVSLNNATTYYLLICSDNVNAAKAFYVDGVQIESVVGAGTSAATAYCDGSMGLGYSWTGTAHASTSIRLEGSLSILDCYGTVAWASTDTTAKTQTYTFTRSATDAGHAGNGIVVGADALVIDYGVTGDGFWEVTTLDKTGSPYAQVVTWATLPTTQTVRVRLGSLDGVAGIGDEWGMFAGSTADYKYLLASDTHFELHGISLSLYDGATKTVFIDPTNLYFALGATVPTGFLVNDGIWFGKDTAYKMRVGTVSGGALVKGWKWDGADLTIIGGITATTGAIGGWVINATSLTDVAGTVGMSSAVTGGDDIRFWAGDATPANAEFKVTKAGVLTASSGTVGGWTLAATTLTGTNVVLTNTGIITAGTGDDVAIISAADATYRLWIGDATAADATFSVTKAGALKATSGTIGGFTITAAELYAGTGATRVEMQAAGGFWAGATALVDAPFSVTPAGVLTAESGTIGAWTIAATYLYTATAGMATADYPFYAGDTYANRASAEFRVTTAGALVATNATITGSLTAGGGNTLLDADGVRVKGGTSATYGSTSAYVIRDSTDAKTLAHLRCYDIVGITTTALVANAIYSGSFVIQQENVAAYLDLMVHASATYESHALLHAYSGSTETKIELTSDSNAAVTTIAAITAAKTTVSGYLDVADYVTAAGGVNIGAAGDPGTNNLVVQGTSTLTGNVTVSADILPDADSTSDLGSSSKYFALAYIDTLTISGTSTLTGAITATAGVAGTLNVLSGAATSALRLADVATDDTNKIAYITMRHYHSVDSAEQDLLALISYCSNTDSYVCIGGGTSTFNAAKRVLVYTAADTTTTGGTCRLTIDGNGNIVPGTAALATNATDGFLYLPTCAGAPSGTPTAFTGRVAMIYDTTDDALYIYDGAWLHVHVAA